jgi:hypothetical protein
MFPIIKEGNSKSNKIQLRWYKISSLEISNKDMEINKQLTSNRLFKTNKSKWKICYDI